MRRPDRRGDGTADESGDGISAENDPFPIKGSDKTLHMDWTTDGHTEVSAPVTAEGPGADQFTGQHPNTLMHASWRTPSSSENTRSRLG
jgi:alkaline phosphatase